MSSPGHHRVQFRWGVKIPTRDGIQLNATLYLPDVNAVPAPVVFTFTPYVAQFYHEQGMYFASHGYPFAAVDVRGRGNSEGEFHPLNDSRDGYDTVEWLARQPYCNGKVVMWGGSYGGYAQWATAKELPPHLATIVPVAAPYRGVDSPLRNNIFVSYTVQWLTLISGRTSQERIFFGGGAEFWRDRFRCWFESGMAYKDLDTFIGNPSSLFQEWVSHPQQDAYWDGYNPTAEQYAQLTIPVLTITGAYDSDQAGALAHYREHLRNAPAADGERHYLIIGPWDHAGTRLPTVEFGGIKVGPASQIDIPALHLQWYDWTTGTGPKPGFLRNNVAYYVIGADKWRYAPTLEAVTERLQALYLSSTGNPTDVLRSGLLTEIVPKECMADSYTYDPRDVSSAEWESPLDPENLTEQTPVFASTGKHLVYHSAPFQTDVEVSGFFKLNAWIAIDQPDTDFQISVFEIGIDGRSVLLSRDTLRARYRRSFRTQELIGSQEPLQYVFERFNFVSRLILKGSRLRLVIGPINSLHSQKNYNTGGLVAEESVADARSVVVHTYHDSIHPSALYVPLGKREAAGEV